MVAVPSWGKKLAASVVARLFGRPLRRRRARRPVTPAPKTKRSRRPPPRLTPSPQFIDEVAQVCAKESMRLQEVVADVPMLPVLQTPANDAPPFLGADPPLKSARERELLAYLLMGLSRLQMSERTGCKVPGLNTHLQKIRRKLGLRGRVGGQHEARAAMFAAARENGWLAADGSVTFAWWPKGQGPTKVLGPVPPPAPPPPAEPEQEITIPAVARARESGGRRNKAIEGRTLTREEKRAAALIVYPEDPDRPRTRGDCADGPRPCPYVSCAHHLYLDVNGTTGAIKLNFPQLEVEEMRESCALDVADRGGLTLDEAGKAINVTRERVRQIEGEALRRLSRKPLLKEIL